MLQSDCEISHFTKCLIISLQSLYIFSHYIQSLYILLLYYIEVQNNCIEVQNYYIEVQNYYIEVQNFYIEVQK